MRRCNYARSPVSSQWLGYILRRIAIRENRVCGDRPERSRAIGPREDGARFDNQRDLRRVTGRGQLALHELCVQPAAGQQALVRPGFSHPSFIEHDD